MAVACEYTQYSEIVNTAAKLYIIVHSQSSHGFWHELSDSDRQISHL